MGSCELLPVSVAGIPPPCGVPDRVVRQRAGLGKAPGVRGGGKFNDSILPVTVGTCIRALQFPSRQRPYPLLHLVSEQ